MGGAAWEKQRGVGDGVHRGAFPVFLLVGIEVGELDGGALAVEPEVGFLAGGNGAVDDRGAGAVGELHVGHREVLDLDLVVQVVDHGAHFGPFAHEVEQVVHGVDALAGGRAAELGGPLAPPRHRVVGGVAEPEGVADREQRAAEAAGVEQRAHVDVRRRETHLEHAGGEPARALFRGLDAVEFGERGTEGLLAQHPGTGLHRGDGHVGVQGGRGRDKHEVGLLRLQHRRVVRVGRGNPGARAEVLGALGIDVAGGDEFDPVGQGGDGAHVGISDATGADEGDAIGFVHGVVGESRTLRMIAFA